MGGVSSGSGDGDIRDGGNTRTFDGLGSRIDALKREQAELLAKKKQCVKDLKNAERRRRRLKKKARTLSADDLQQLLEMRSAAEVEETVGGASGAGSTKKKQKKNTE